MNKGFWCPRCKKSRSAAEKAGTIPGVGVVCVSCLNGQIKRPDNRMVSSGEIQTRNPLKMLPSEKLAKRQRNRRRKMSVSLTGGFAVQGCSRFTHLAPTGASA